jgi:pyridoxamine 5'-phosphate oxidase family protein
MTSFSPPELAYLASQRLGRLATVDRHGTPQNNPVGFAVADDGAVVIGGWNLGRSRKFRNLATNDRVSLVVDDIASLDPWVVRGVEIRGRAEALTDVEPIASYTSREQIRIHPDRIRSWGLDDPERR